MRTTRQASASIPRLAIVFRSGLIATATLALLGGHCPAAPTISGVSGQVGQGELFTITGDGFGSEPNAAPYRFDDFEHGTAGNDLTWWGLSKSSGDYPKFTTAQVYSGNLAAKANFDGQYNCTAYKTGFDFDEAYISYWVYWLKLSGDASRNIKLARFVSHTTDYKSGTPSLGYTGFYTSSSIWYAFNGLPDGPDNDVQVWGGYVTAGTWHRIEMYGKISTLNQDDGARGWWLDLNEVDYDNAFATYTSSTDRDSYRCITMPFYVAHDAGGPHYIYYDDVFVNNTFARVEIGNAATWSGCTVREIQLPTSWSNTSIAVTTNQAKFSNGQQVWLYVVDRDGNVNQSGYPLTIGGTITYDLTVTNGTGGGEYEAGSVVSISANPPDTGKLFSRWIGDTSYVTHTYAADTTVTMPTADVSVTATYGWGYQLTVNSGSGSGLYLYAAVVPIQADPAPTGMVFDQWIGDTAGVADVHEPETTISMSSSAVEVTAAYESPLPGDLDGSGLVGQGDLDIVLDNWGDCPPADPRSDPSGDGFVGQGDLDIVLGHWGESAGPGG